MPHPLHHLQYHNEDTSAQPSGTFPVGNSRHLRDWAWEALHKIKTDSNRFSILRSRLERSLSVVFLFLELSLRACYIPKWLAPDATILFAASLTSTVRSHVVHTESPNEGTALVQV